MENSFFDFLSTTLVPKLRTDILYTVAFAILVRSGLYIAALLLPEIIVSERPSSALSVKRFRCVWVTYTPGCPYPNSFLWYFEPF